MFRVQDFDLCVKEVFYLGKNISFGGPEGRYARHNVFGQYVSSQSLTLILLRRSESVPQNT